MSIYAYCPPLYSSADHRHLHSFPTRRSSDLFTEYAWDMNGCDPCAAEPLSFEELRGLGVFWLTQGRPEIVPNAMIDRKSTRLNSSHVEISYAVFCLKKKSLGRQRDGLPGEAG